MVPIVTDNNNIGTQQTVSLDSDEQRACEGRQTNNFQNWFFNYLVIVADVTWLKYCRYVVKQYPTYQSIN